MNEKQLELVNFSQAKRLKELGFEWHVNVYFVAKNEIDDVDYNTNFNDPVYEDDGVIASSPTVALALKWMRDVKGLEGYVMRIYNKKFMSVINSPHYQKDMPLSDEYLYKTYEDAESVLLDELLTIFEK